MHFSVRECSRPGVRRWRRPWWGCTGPARWGRTWAGPAPRRCSAATNRSDWTERARDLEPSLELDQDIPKLAEQQFWAESDYLFLQNWFRQLFFAYTAGLGKWFRGMSRTSKILPKWTKFNHVFSPLQAKQFCQILPKKTLCQNDICRDGFVGANFFAKLSLLLAKK